MGWWWYYVLWRNEGERRPHLDPLAELNPSRSSDLASNDARARALADQARLSLIPPTGGPAPRSTWPGTISSITRYEWHQDGVYRGVPYGHWGPPVRVWVGSSVGGARHHERAAVRGARMILALLNASPGAPGDVGGPIFERDADEVREYGAELAREVNAFHADVLAAGQTLPPSDATTLFFGRWASWVANFKIWYAQNFDSVAGRPLWDTLNLWNEVEQRELELTAQYDELVALGATPTTKRPIVGPETPPTKPIGKEDITGALSNILTAGVIVAIAYFGAQALAAHRRAEAA